MVFMTWELNIQTPAERMGKAQNFPLSLLVTSAICECGQPAICSVVPCLGISGLGRVTGHLINSWQRLKDGVCGQIHAKHPQEERGNGKQTHPLGVVCSISLLSGGRTPVVHSTGQLYKQLSHPFSLLILTRTCEISHTSLTLSTLEMTGPDANESGKMGLRSNSENSRDTRAMVPRPVFRLLPSNLT